MTTAWAQDLVRNAMAPDDEWAVFAEHHNPVVLVSEMKRVIADIGQQEHHRAQGLGLLRDDPIAVANGDYETARRGHRIWKRSIAQVIPRLRQRIADLQPQAQALVDAHQADRRSLVVLAKRIWLWEEGLEDDGLDDALDDVTISEGAGDLVFDRKTLRDLIGEFLENGQEINP